MGRPVFDHALHQVGEPLASDVVTDEDDELEGKSLHGRCKYVVHVGVTSTHPVVNKFS